MTAILGLTCTDGILMLADTEESTSEGTKSECDKLRHFLLPHGQMLLGGAGDSHFVEYAMRQLSLSILQKPRTWDEIEEDLNAEALRIFSRMMEGYKGLTYCPEEIAMLIAISSNGEVRLYEWQHDTVIPIVNAHTSIGAGRIQMHPMLADLKFAIPARAMLLYGVHIMRQTKFIVKSCGGKSEGIALHPGRGRTHFFSETTSRVEEVLVQLIDYTNRGLWILVAALDENDKEFKRLMESMPEDLRQFRTKYKEIVL